MSMRPPITWHGTPLTEMTGEQILQAKERLKEAWFANLPDQAVLTFSGLTKDAIEMLKAKDPKLAAYEKEQQGMVALEARANLAKEIRLQENTTMSMRYLEKTDPEFQPKARLEMQGQTVVVPVEDREAALRKELEDKFGLIGKPDDSVAAVQETNGTDQ